MHTPMQRQAADLSTREAFAFPGLSPRTLYRDRVTDEGPPRFRLGGRFGRGFSVRMMAVLSGPEIPEAEGDRVEGADTDRIFVLRTRNRHPLPIAQLERLQGASRRVHEP